MSDSNALDELVRLVRASPKYRAMSEELVRAIGARELAARRSLKEAVKATRNRLHQVAGAYLDDRPRYDAWLAELAEVRAAGEPALRAACLRIMRHHASTRERLPFLESFYASTLGHLGPIRSVLDVACGFNPLALAWMPLAPGATYTACDIYSDMVAFLQGFFELIGARGGAEVCDLVASVPAQQADVALALKVLPPLEQLQKGAGARLLRELNARHVLVSFPARSLGGRDKGMIEHYERQFRALAEAEGWPVERFEFPTELAFLIRKA